MKRDDYFRCRYCKKLFTNDECAIDPTKGYQCPNGCEEEYNQPPYELPTNETSDDSQEM